MLSEKGPLQFTGGSFVHWQVGNPNEYKIEIAFSIRTRQQSGPLFAVNWNALRAFRIRLVNNGNLAVSPIDFTTGRSVNDWVISGRTQLGDGQWHRVRFVLFASATDSNGKFDSSSLCRCHTKVLNLEIAYLGLSMSRQLFMI